MKDLVADSAQQSPSFDDLLLNIHEISPTEFPSSLYLSSASSSPLAVSSLLSSSSPKSLSSSSSSQTSQTVQIECKISDPFDFMMVASSSLTDQTPCTLWDLEKQLLVGCSYSFQQLIGYNFEELQNSFGCSRLAPERLADSTTSFCSALLFVTNGQLKCKQ